MKFKFFALASIVMFFSFCQRGLAQQPQLAKTHTAVQLDSLLIDFFSIDARDINYPETSITTKFKSQFPNAYDVDWETRNNLFLVEFEISRVDYEALYDHNANLLMYKCDVPRSAIPNAVKKSVSARYKGMRIDGSEKIVTAYGEQYKLEMESGKQEIKAYFNADGSFIKEY